MASFHRPSKNVHSLALVLLASGLTCAPPAKAEESDAYVERETEEAPIRRFSQHVFLEGGGAAGLYSVNLETRLPGWFRDVHLRAGFSHVPFKPDETLTVFPFSVSYTGIGSETQHLELGASAAYARRYFGYENNEESAFVSHAIIFGPYAGYRYQDETKRFVFRGGAFFINAVGGNTEGVHLPWPYLSFGVNL